MNTKTQNKLKGFDDRFKNLAFLANPKQADDADDSPVIELEAEKPLEQEPETEHEEASGLDLDALMKQEFELAAEADVKAFYDAARKGTLLAPPAAPMTPKLVSASSGGGSTPPAGGGAPPSAPPSGNGGGSSTPPPATAAPAADKPKRGAKKISFELPQLPTERTLAFDRPQPRQIQQINVQLDQQPMLASAPATAPDITLDGDDRLKSFAKRVVAPEASPALTGKLDAVKKRVAKIVSGE